MPYFPQSFSSLTYNPGISGPLMKGILPRLYVKWTLIVSFRISTENHMVKSLPSFIIWRIYLKKSSSTKKMNSHSGSLPASWPSSLCCLFFWQFKNSAVLTGHSIPHWCSSAHRFFTGRRDICKSTWSSPSSHREVFFFFTGITTLGDSDIIFSFLYSSVLLLWQKARSQWPSRFRQYAYIWLLKKGFLLSSQNRHGWEYWSWSSLSFHGI